MRRSENEGNYTEAYEPENVLRKIIGNDVLLKDIFTPEKILACQKRIDVARDDFFDKADIQLEELKNMLNLAITPFEEIAFIAENIRGQAKFFHFPFIASVCSHITDYSQAASQPTQTRLAIIQKLAEALQIAFKTKIRDEGGVLQHGLQSSLNRLPHSE